MALVVAAMVTVVAAMVTAAAGAGGGGTQVSAHEPKTYDMTLPSFSSLVNARLK